MRNNTNIERELLNPTFCASTQEQLLRHTSAVVPQIRELCRRSALPDEVTQNIVADFLDYLQDAYRGHCLSVEGINLIAAKTSRQEWNEIQSPVLRLLIRDYQSTGGILTANSTDEINEMLADPDKICLAINAPGSCISAVTIYEVATHLKANTAELFNYAVGNLHIDMLFFYVQGLAIPASDLQGVLPLYVGAESDEERERINGGLLEKQFFILKTAEKNLKLREQEGDRRNPIAGLYDENGERIKAAPQKKEDTPGATDEAVTNTYAAESEDAQAEQTIAIYQPISALLGKPMDVVGKNEDSTKPLQPLAAALEDQRKRAELIKGRLDDLRGNPNTDKAALQDAILEARKAEDLITSQTYIWQAFTGIAALANKGLPNGASGDYYDYGEMKVNDFIRLCIGEKKDGNGNLQSITEKQRIGILRGANYISSIRCRTSETVQYTKFKKNNEGEKVATTEDATISYQFTPAIINFRSVKVKSDAAKDADFITIHIYRNIVTGRRRDTVEEIKGGRIKQPQQHILSAAQYYAFSNENQRRFLNILISSQHKKEDELLAAVFDYGGTRAVAKNAGKKAEQELKEYTDALKDRGEDSKEINADATLVKLRAEEMQAKAKITKTEKSIIKHRGRDREELKRLFKLAAEIGVIQAYWRTPSLSENSKAPGVWNWKRPTSAEVKQRRRNKERTMKK